MEKYCPKCFKKYPPETEVCPADGAFLVSSMDREFAGKEADMGLRIVGLLVSCTLIAACGSGASSGSADGGVGDTVGGLPKTMAASDPNLVGELPGSPGLVVLNEVLLTATEGASATDVTRLAAEMDGEVVGHLGEIRLWQVRIGNENASPEVLLAAFDVCRQDPAAEHCFANAVLFPQDIYPDDGYEWNGKTDDCACAEAWEDPDIRNQTWGQRAIDLPEAWSLTTGSPEVPIAVLDEGVFIKHRDFGGAGALKFGSSWKNSHGTHVTGILGARGDNKKDIAGVNWQAPLWFYELQGLWGKEPVSPVVIGGVPLSAAQSAFIHAGLDGVRLVNFSFGRTWKDDDLAGKKWCPGDGKAAGGYSAEEWQSWLEADRKAWRPVMKVLQKHGVLVVAAAGNNSAVFSNNCEVDAKWTGGPQAAAEEFPDNVLVVASVGDPTDAGTYFGEWADQWHALSPFSSTGAGVAVAAPGSMILSLCQFGSLTCPTSHTYYASGTSMAAPFVTGLASLVWSLRPEFTPGEVKAKILSGAKRAGPQVFRRLVPGQAEPVELYPFHVINAYETLRILGRKSGCTDLDGDGYGKVEEGGGVGLDCGHEDADCDDADNKTYPKATEVCDNKDNNCNGHTDEENVCKGQLAGAPISGVVPGEFSTDGGTFELSVSPLDKNGDLIFQNLSTSNFTFHDIGVFEMGAWGSEVATGTAWPEAVELVPPAAPGDPLSAILLLDSSGSMSESDPTYERVQAAQLFLAKLGEEDRVAVMDFGSDTGSGYSCARVLAGFTKDKSAAQAALSQVTADGGTPLFCAVEEAVDLLSSESNSRRVVLLLTDGQSTEDYPESAENSAEAAASAVGANVYAVGLGYSLDFSLLQAIAQGSGGSFALAGDAQVLAGLFDAIGVASTKGKVIVHGKGIFEPPVQQAGQYKIEGVLRTSFGGSSTDTAFEFGVYLE